MLDCDNTDKEHVLKKCDEYKATIEELEQENNRMITKIQEMSDSISKSALQNKQISEDHQDSVKSYKEKLENQDIELKEFRSDVARLKLDLETAKEVCDLLNNITHFVQKL